LDQLARWTGAEGCVIPPLFLLLVPSPYVCCLWLPLALDELVALRVTCSAGSYARLFWSLSPAVSSPCCLTTRFSGSFLLFKKLALLLPVLLPWVRSSCSRFGHLVLPTLSPSFRFECFFLLIDLDQVRSGFKLWLLWRFGPVRVLFSQYSPPGVQHLARSGWDWPFPLAPSVSLPFFRRQLVL